ncbi:MAG: class I SAM-dependent methyltransferase [Woeseiaceae bacterium]|nr:class I SAM-dependent methyltransferase [Woeseiaceae bacterium]
MTDCRNGAGWDTFWNTSTAQASYCSDAGAHPVLGAHWRGKLTALPKLSSSSRHIDLATGNGIVIRYVRSLLGANAPRTWGLDLSAAAIDRLKRDYPDVIGVVADVGSTGLDGATFDLVTSQFGVEYAGLEGFVEAARLVRPGGTLAVVAHSRPGIIHDECATNIDVIERVRSEGIFRKTRTHFAIAGSYGRSVGAGRALKGYKQGRRQLRRLLQQFGAGAANGFLLQLNNDLERIGSRVSSYDSRELGAWLHKLDCESLDYLSRMNAMTRAALSRQDLGRVVLQLERSGMAIDEVEAIFDDDVAQIGWSITARRHSGV